MKKLTIKTIDQKIEQEFVSAFVFTVNYHKKLKPKEFHCPEAARLIVQTDGSFFQYLLISPLIRVNKKVDIKVDVAHSVENMLNDKQFYSKNQDLENFILKKIYSEKAKLGLSVSEILEYEESKISSTLNKLLKIKIPEEIGGGF